MIFAWCYFLFTRGSFFFIARALFFSFIVRITCYVCVRGRGIFRDLGGVLFAFLPVKDRWHDYGRFILYQRGIGSLFVQDWLLINNGSTSSQR